MDNKDTTDNNNNNNKRKVIESDNNNDDKITYKKFKNEIGSELSTIKYKELQSIAGSLGLLKNGTKEVLYGNIEKYLLNLESIQPITVINPFNKHQPKLLIKDNLEPIEIPFWKVFRNKSIFNEIFSNFKNKRLNSYRDLKCTNQFLNNYSNSINIIIDNIKCNNYFHQIINNEDDIKNILLSISKDNQETRSFYNLLFSTYSSSETSTNINFNNNIPKWIQYMIFYPNLVALDQFIKYFNIDKRVVKEISNDLNYKIFPNGIDVDNKKMKLNVINYLIDNNYIISATQFIIRYIQTLFKGEFSLVTFSFSTKIKSLINIYTKLISIYQKFNQCILKVENRIKLEKLILEINEITTTGTFKYSTTT